MLDVLSIGGAGFGDEILLGAWLTLKLAVASLLFGPFSGIGSRCRQTLQIEGAPVYRQCLYRGHSGRA